ncbi:MAG: sensor histidine kinase [Maricaulis sp.]|jgi:two-component system sensor histidine kinase DesK|nr:sensor histidine kinase [Maricaulis sp.]MDG2044494.1 sensor histidine kinase [Maricaulis sp.]
MDDPETISKTDQSDRGTPWRPKMLGSRREFYLVYLLFYGVPWFFRAPELIDIGVLVVALAVFLPLFYRGFENSTPRDLWIMIAMEVISIAAMPFHGSHGVFHIYACVQASYQKPSRYGMFYLIALSTVFLAASLYLQSHVFEIALNLVMGFIVGISCMASAEYRDRQGRLERARVLDQQLAAIAERERIARDLHDLLGHTLTMVAVKSQVAEKFLTTEPERAAREIREIRDASRGALQDVRKAVANMGGTTLEEEIAHAGHAFNAAGINFTVEGDIPDLDARRSQVLGLAVRETSTNIIRHSGARQACLQLQHDGQAVVVEMQDDGDGGSIDEGSGLKGLRQRVEALNGRVVISLAAGFRISMHIPDGKTGIKGALT